MGCFSFVETWIVKRKEARRERKRARKQVKEVSSCSLQPSPRHDSKEGEIVPKEEKSTSGGYSCLLEISPSKKRVPAGLKPISIRKVLTADELAAKREKADERRRARLDEKKRKRAARAAKREQSANAEVRESTSVPTKTEVALDEEEDPDVKRLKKRCDSARPLRKLRYFIKYGTTNPSVIMRCKSWQVSSDSY